MALRRLFGGKSEDLERLPVELKGLLEDMRRERSAFEAAVVRSSEVVKGAEGLAEPVAQAQRQLADLAQRLTPLDGVPATLAQVRKDLEELASGAQVARDQLVEARQAAADMRTELEAVRGMAEETRAFRQEVAEILGQKERLPELEGQLRDLTERVGQARQHEGAVQQGLDQATSRLAEVENRWLNVSTAVDMAQARAAAFDRTAAELRELASGIPNAKRELATLQAMAEFVAQKVATLEGQRDAIERTTKGAERLAELMAQVDRQIREQQTNARFLTQLEEQVNALKRLHEGVMEQTEEISNRQRAVQAEDQSHREAFASMKAEVQDALSGFAFERDGLATMNQRVVELRGMLGAVEQRLPAVETARHAADAAIAAADHLASRLEAVSAEVEQLEADAGTLRAVREEAARVAAEARELLRRAEHAQQPATFALEETAARVAELNGQIEGLEKRALQLEAYRAGLAEMGRELTARQGSLDQSLAKLDRAAALRADVAGGVDRLEAAAEALELKQTSAADAAAQMERLVQELEERARQFGEIRARVARFETRLAALAGAEEKLDRSLALATERHATVNALRDEVQRLFQSVDSTVERARTVAALQKEIEQRRSTVDEIAGKLSELVREGEILERLRPQFQEAERRLSQLDAHLSTLQTMLDTVLKQKEFLDRVVETTGALAFQSMQAEAVLASLRQEQEGARAGAKRGTKK